MTGQVVHFEIPADDVSRAQAFYREAFGWQINEVPGMSYALVNTTETDENGVPRTPGAINGGMMARMGPVTAPVVSIDTEDIEATLKVVEKLGGSVAMPKMKVGEIGFAAYFADTEGNVVGLDETNAETSLATVSLTVSGNGISSDFLMARSNASCGPAVAGSSQLQNLVINGQPITVTGNPNQTVSLPNGTATINEQTPAVAGSTAELRVVALHVITIDAITGQVLADVQLAIADAMIDCQPGSGPPGDATTGGGWITLTSGGKGTFGVGAAYRPDGSLTGHLVYIDHDIDMKGQS